MMNTKEQMMDEVIKTRGFEDKMTVWFCGLCEKHNDLQYLRECMAVALLSPM